MNRRSFLGLAAAAPLVAPAAIVASAEASELSIVGLHVYTATLTEHWTRLGDDPGAKWLYEVFKGDQLLRAVEVDRPMFITTTIRQEPSRASVSLQFERDSG